MSQGVSPLAYLFSAAISSPTSLTLSTPPRGIPVHRKNFVASLVFFPASTGLVSLRYFWALPPLGVTGPDVRDLMGYRITIMLQGLPNLHPGGMIATGLKLFARVEVWGIPAMPAYHPAALLRDPSRKRPFRADLLAALERCGAERRP